MKQTLSALVKNSPGVLHKMAAEFHKYCINIKSISAGETENPDISRMVICTEAKDDEIERITEAMGGMDFVIQIDDLGRKEFVDRELVLIKVTRSNENITQLMQIFEVFRASVVGMGQLSITVELSGDQERVEGLITMLEPFGIKGMCRTGMIGLRRGDEQDRPS